VLAELGHDEVRERDDPPTGLRLGRPERVTAAALVDDLAGYPHGAGVEVDVWRAERGEFGPAETGEGGQEQERPVSRADRVGQGEDLSDGEDRAFWGVFGASPFDAAWVAAD